MCGAFSFQTGNRRRKSRLVAKRSGGQNRRRRRCLFRRVVTKVWLSSLIMKPEIVDLWPMVKTGAVLTPRNRSPHILRTLLVFLPCRWCCTMSTNSLFTPAFFTVKRPFPCGLWTNQDVPATNQVSSMFAHKAPIIELSTCSNHQLLANIVRAKSVKYHPVYFIEGQR